MREIDLFDLGDPMALSFGMDDWAFPLQQPPQTLTDVFDRVEARAHIGALVPPYHDSVGPALHCTLVNWLVRRVITDGVISTHYFPMNYGTPRPMGVRVL